MEACPPSNVLFNPLLTILWIAGGESGSFQIPIAPWTQVAQINTMAFRAAGQGFKESAQLRCVGPDVGADFAGSSWTEIRLQWNLIDAYCDLLRGEVADKRWPITTLRFGKATATTAITRLRCRLYRRTNCGVRAADRKTTGIRVIISP